MGLFSRFCVWAVHAEAVSADRFSTNVASAGESGGWRLRRADDILASFVGIFRSVFLLAEQRIKGFRYAPIAVSQDHFYRVGRIVVLRGAASGPGHTAG
jgi:hypothetical protein